MAAMGFLLEKPFKMNPSVNLVHLHREELSATAIQAAELEESCKNRPDMEGVRPPASLMSPNGRGFNSPSFMAPSRLYSAEIFKAGASCSTRLCPGKILVTPIPLSGPTPEHVAAAISQFGLNLSLNSSSSGCQQQFCFLGATEDSDQNYVDTAPNRSNTPDLNFSPPHVTAPVTEFVGEMKSQNISRFTDNVLSYLSKYGSNDQELDEYWNLLSNITEAQLGDLDSTRIWNILTLPGEIQKVLVDKGLIETPICFDDLGFPPPQEMFPIPQQDWKATNNDAAIDCQPTAAPIYNCNNETLPDAPNYATPDGNRSSKGKRKIVVAAADMDNPYPYDHLRIKKPRQGGVLRIN